MCATRRSWLRIALLAASSVSVPGSEGRESWLGLWVQQDSGAVLDFRADGKVGGWPVTGSYQLKSPARIVIQSANEKLDCAWKKKDEDRLELTRPINGQLDTIELLRLKPAPLDIPRWKGRYLIQHMVAAGKTATERAVKLEDTGHFRTKEGGYYLRLISDASGKVLGYASGEEDDTIAVQVFIAGVHLVLFDRLEKPRLLASCLRVD